MKDLFAVTVECHAGYKADEYPTCFYWDNIRFEIEEVVDRWYQGDQNSDFPPANYFKVRTASQKMYILKHDTGTGNWFLWIREETLNL